MTRFFAILLAGFLLLAALPARAQTAAPPAADKSADAPVMQTGRIQLPTGLGELNIPSDQEKINVLQNTLDMLAKLPKKTQDALIEESMRNRGYCRRNTMLSNFYDCSCFALRMLDSRIRKGPDVAMNNMISGTDLGICASAPSAAGYTYLRCRDTLMMDHLDENDLNTMCECAARSMTAHWSNSPAASIFVVNEMFMQSMTTCQQQLQPVLGQAPAPP